MVGSSPWKNRSFDFRGPGPRLAVHRQFWGLGFRVWTILGEAGGGQEANSWKWRSRRARTCRRREMLVPPRPWITSILVIGTRVRQIRYFAISHVERHFITTVHWSGVWCCCWYCFRDERFSREEHYEWFKDYSHFRHLIQQNVKPDSSVSTASFRDFWLPDALCLFFRRCCVSKVQNLAWRSSVFTKSWHWSIADLTLRLNYIDKFGVEFISCRLSGCRINLLIRFWAKVYLL